MSEISTQWEELMTRAGYSSLRKLSEACGVSPATAAGIVLHGKRGSDESRQKIADALGITVAQMNEISTGRREEPLQMPKGTEILSLREKEAVAEIIRTIVNAKEQVNELTNHQGRPRAWPTEHPEDHDPAEPVEEKKSSRPSRLASVHPMSPRSDKLIEQPLGNAARTVKNAKTEESDDPA